MFCKHCGYEMVEGLIICPNCLKNIGEIVEIKFDKPRRNKKIRTGLSEEEILLLGLYPKDEGYKMSLILRILGLE